MTGVEEYKLDSERKINSYIKSHPQLKGYSKYLKMNKTLGTVQRYTEIVGLFLAYCQKEPKELEFDDFIDFMSHDSSSITNGYLILRYHALKTFCSYLYDTNVITYNYMMKIPRPKSSESKKTIEKREKGFLTSEEIKIVLKNIENDVKLHTTMKYKMSMKERDMAIVLVFLTTGIRKSALVKLDLKDIDLENKTLWVTDKGNKVRNYVLNDKTIEAIKNWLIKRPKYFNENSNDALFLNKYGKRFGAEGIDEIIKKYTYNIEGKQISAHKLRATYGTQLYEATKDIYFVQKAMGHSSPTTTERYIRGQHDTTKKASDIMESLL